MSLVLDILAWAALLAGSFFTVIGAIGLLRLPDIFTRTHAASVNDTLGVGFLVLGMLLQTDDWLVAVRLVIILVVVLTTGAVAVHALARAALHDGERPLLAGSDGRLRPMEIGSVYPDLARRLERPLISEQVDDALPLAGDQDSAAGQKKEGPPWNS